MMQSPVRHYRCRSSLKGGLLLLLFAAGGCAGAPWTQNKMPDMAKQRKLAARTEFQQQSQEAEYQVALQCYREGNVVACRQRLAKLLKKAPRNTEAQQLLAKLDAAPTDEVVPARGEEPIAGDLEGTLKQVVAPLRANRPEQTIQLALSALDDYPRSAELHRALGTAYYRVSEYQLAKESLEKSISLDKTSGLSYFLLGNVCEKLGDSQAAAAHFAEARRLSPALMSRR